MVKIAQIGAGRMGALHAANAAANPRLELVYIADHDDARAGTLAAQVGARAASIAHILADETIEGVVVAASTDALLESSLACLGAGKAVFSEKPLSLSLEALEAAARDLAEDAPPLFVAFNRRFDPHFAALKSRLAEGEIGDLETLHLINHDPVSPSPAFIPRSGGLFKDFTVHDFDTASWLLDEPVSEIFAWASCLIDPRVGELGDVDTAKLVLKTRSGRLCLISNSRRTGYGYDQRIEAFGSKGALRVDNVRATGVTRCDSAGPHHDVFHHAFPARYADAYRLELDHFADLLIEGGTPRTSFKAAINALRLAEAAAESVQNGTAVTIAGEGHDDA